MIFLTRMTVKIWEDFVSLCYEIVYLKRKREMAYLTRLACINFMNNIAIDFDMFFVSEVSLKQTSKNGW